MNNPILSAAQSAQAQYLASLCEQLQRYKQLEEASRLVILPAALNAPCYSIQFDDVNQVYTLQEHIFDSIDQMLEASRQTTIYDTEKVAQDECNKANRRLTTPFTACPTSAPAYTPRSELDETTVQTLRKKDRQYYADNREAINAKDREKYHRLHPNARTYKKRKKSGEQLTIEGVIDNESLYSE